MTRSDYVFLSQEQLEKIFQPAYELYEARGRKQGYELEDWRQAEAESAVPIAQTVTPFPRTTWSSALGKWRDSSTALSIARSAQERCLRGRAYSDRRGH